MLLVPSKEELKECGVSEKKISVSMIFVAWLTFGQLAMLANSHLGEAPPVSEIFNAMSKFFPAFSHMNSVGYFDAVLARQQAVLMYLAMPMLLIPLLYSDLRPQYEGVLKKGKRNVIAVMLVCVAVGLLPFFFGLAPRRFLAVLRETQIGFAFLSALVTFCSVYFLRLAACLFVTITAENK